MFVRVRSISIVKYLTAPGASAAGPSDAPQVSVPLHTCLCTAHGSGGWVGENGGWLGGGMFTNAGAILL